MGWLPELSNCKVDLSRWRLVLQKVLTKVVRVERPVGPAAGVLDNFSEVTYHGQTSVLAELP